MSPDEMVARLTAVMRVADKAFESVGGSTRHHVRDCLVPALEADHLTVVHDFVPNHLASAERDVASLAEKLDASERLVHELTSALEALCPDADEPSDTMGATESTRIVCLVGELRRARAAIQKARGQ